MKSRHRSPRMLTTAVCGALLTLGLTGTMTTTASAASPTSGFRACYDLNCTKRIAEGKSFNANGDHGITKVRITRVNSNGITLKVSGSNWTSTCSGYPHLNCTINGLDIWTTSRKGDTAVFHIWP